MNIHLFVYIFSIAALNWKLLYVLIPCFTVTFVQNMQNYPSSVFHKHQIMEPPHDDL
jgi:hypothetical protein